MQRVTTIKDTWAELRELERDLKSKLRNGVVIICHKHGDTIRQADPFPAAQAIMTGSWREASKQEADAYFKAQRSEAASAAKE